MPTPTQWAVIAGVCVYMAVIGLALLSFFLFNIVKPDFVQQEGDGEAATKAPAPNWKETSLSQLLGPLYMQLSRIKRLFKSLEHQGESQLASRLSRLKEAITDIQNTLLHKVHLIPPHLVQDADLLLEYCDHWLEKEDQLHTGDNADPSLPFNLVNLATSTFPTLSSNRFHGCFQNYWNELYSLESA